MTASDSGVPHTHGTGAGGEGIHPPHGTEPKGRYFYLLALGAVGVVYGDIGTSPLYALRECFYGPHAIGISRANVLGILSLIFWALIIVISVKYLVFVMRADNRGEGGTLALLSLLRVSGKVGRSRPLLIALGLFGAALIYGDGVITPAVSVLSAVEGLQIAVPTIGHRVVPITIAIIVALFLVQRRGTGGIGKIFGPLTLSWFITIAVLGAIQIVREPSVLAAILPTNAVSFFMRNGYAGFVVLGSVVLVVTGGEALYADMGHFGRRPIRFAWFAIVLPALLLSYFGQGAFILNDPESAAEHVFFRLAPDWMTIPLVVLATAAASIASQAMISGAFSLTRQAVQLGYCPRVQIEHTSAREIGQIYIPGVNWALMIATIGLVLWGGSASELAAAYGIAVTSTFVITTLLFFMVARERFGWKLHNAILVTSILLLVDLAFFSANALKFLDGGFIPIVIAAVIYIMMSTWKKGRMMLRERLQEKTLPIDLFMADVGQRKQGRVAGTAVFMTGSADGIPPALMHNLKHNKVIHEQVLLLTVVTREVPHVDAQERIEVKQLNHGFYRVMAYYGFMEDPNIPDVMKLVRGKGVMVKPMETTFFLGHDTLITTSRKGMARWRKKLFEIMMKNARSATAYFGIPYNQVVELGAQIEL
ncbi:MAG: potassium transporter Kup [Gemmatimonadota bacterium]